MPVAVHICPHQMSREDYQTVIGELEKTGVKEGRLYHAAYGEDSVQMFEVWQSEDDFEAHRGTLFDVLDGVGVNVDRVDVHPLHSDHPD